MSKVDEITDFVVDKSKHLDLYRSLPRDDDEIRYKLKLIISLGLLLMDPSFYHFWCRKLISILRYLRNTSNSYLQNSQN